MTIPPPDGSRDHRIEDPSNLWLIHPAARLLLPRAVAAGVSANWVSIAGMVLGVGAAFAYGDWRERPMALLGLVLAAGWLIADGLDGMVARATGTASAVGRLLDGVCDHGVFILIYMALASSIDTAEGWALALVAGAAHAVQSSLYEGERARFHRRVKGVAAPEQVEVTGGAVVRGYDRLAGLPERMAQPFERMLRQSPDPRALGQRYGIAAVPPMRILALQTANVRVAAITLACLLGNPRLFWWFEIVPLMALAIVGLAWHRRVEQRLVAGTASSFAADDRPSHSLFVKEQGHQ